MKFLTIKNMYQQYNYGAEGVKNLSLECEKGEFFSILGNPEAGKTSLLKCIAGLYPIKSGEIYIDNKLINDENIKNRDILMIYEDGGLFKHRTIFYNLYYPMKIRGYEKDYIKNEIEKIAKEMNFFSLLAFKVSSLEGKDKVKIMIARAMLRKAKLYLFDDPFKIVEKEYRHKLFIEMLPFIKRLDGAMLFATTSIDEALTVSSNLLIMNYGYVIENGKYSDFNNKPSCLTSYEFIKGYNANTIKTKVFENENGIFVDILGKHVLLNKNNLINNIYIDCEIIVAFVTCQKENGIPIENYFIEYYNNIPYISSLMYGNKIITKLENENINSIDIDLATIKLFDINNEKLIYFN